MVKNVMQFLTADVNTTPISLEAKLDEAFEIVHIGVSASGSLQAADIIIGGQKMLFIPAVPGTMQVAPPPFIGTNKLSLFPYVRARYPEFPRLIVGQGETMDIIARSPGVGCTVHVWYKRHYGDNLPTNTQPGGSQSKNRPYISWAEQLVTVPNGVTQINKITTYLTPAGYPNFPFEGIVLPGTVYKMVGLCAYADSSLAPNTTVAGLRLWKLNEAVLAKDEAFIPFNVFPVPGSSIDKDIYLFEEPIVFGVNETATWEVKATNAGLAPESYLVDISPIFILEPESAGA